MFEDPKVQAGAAELGIIDVTHRSADRIVAGYGHCRSCNCKGYKKKFFDDDYCWNCAHHFTQHN